jgi:hypothetical protein
MSSVQSTGTLPGTRYQPDVSQGATRPRAQKALVYREPGRDKEPAMTRRISRIVSCFASTVSTSPLLIGLALSTSTGCGALAAAGNPKVAWAVTDPAPMSVVVRRADAAQETVLQVDRLLTATPTSLDSSWITRVGPDPNDAADELKEIGQEPIYAQSHARVVAAEVWVKTLSALKSAKGEHPNLLAAIDPDLGTHYADIMAKKVEIAGLVALEEQEKVTIADKDTSAEDKADHTSTLAKLQKMQSDSEAEVAPLETALLASARDAAAKASPDVQQKLGPAIANMLQALSDADVANSAAALRYPMALTSLPSSVKAVVPGIVGDILQEKTGHHVALDGKLDVTVALHGTDVDVTLAGLEPKDLGAVKMDELTKETVVRTSKWALHAVGLLGAVSATKQSLAFETHVLTQIMDGFAPAGGVDALAVKVPMLDGTGAVTGGAVAGVAGAALDKKLPGVPSEGVAVAALDKKVPGLDKKAAGLSGARAATAALDKKVPGLPAAGAATAALDKKVPGLPGAGAATAALDKKVPGAGALAGRVPGMSALAGPPGALENGVPGVAAANAALDKKVPGLGAAASMLEKKVPGGGAIGAAAGFATTAATDPKAAATGLAKAGANAALKKVPGGAMIGGLTGFGK